MGHACLFVKAAGKSFLIDPWLLGSAYWRSWWHFPPAAAVRPEHLSPDFLYLSHHHFDHFHYPTLRKVDKSCRVLIPRFGVAQMPKELKELGFQNVTELRHGEVLDLAAGLRAASYQFGMDDSALILSDGKTVLADLNDCKINGPSVRPLLKEFGRPTFLFKSHSWASAFPNCYSFDEPADRGLALTEEDYIDAFFSSVKELSPRYAVPFASMVGFFHPETRGHNARLITSRMVVESAAARLSAGAQTSVVALSPGDRWSEGAGFQKSAEPLPAALEAGLAEEARKAAPKIALSLEQEKAKTADFEGFRGHLEGFMRALPWPARFLLKRPIVFEVPSDSRRHWILDFSSRTVLRAEALPAGWGSVVRVPEAVLADAVRKRILHFVHISMRISVRVAKGGTTNALSLVGFLVLYELGYLPLRRCLNPRFLGVVWRRRTEILFALSNFTIQRSFAGATIRALMPRKVS